MKRLSQQSGFAVLESILIIVIIAIVGFTGWFVWHSKQSADKTLNNAASTSQNSTAIKTKAKSSTVTTFAECKASAGSIVQESYPETCVTKGGKRFTNPSQTVQSIPQ